ncbi:MAG: hypothetical protein GX895_06910 [Clostridiales bacterium]|nr:hypothetical protein [Clostridiales bacterium]
MKKCLRFIIIMFAIVFLWPAGLDVEAQGTPKLEAKVSGTFEVGNEIEISIYTSNINNLYTGDIRFKIDNSLLEITGVEKGSLLNKEGVNLFEQKTLPTDEDGTKDQARYIFSALGENDGFSGEGTIVVFKAKVLKNDELYVNAKAFQKKLNDQYNMRIELVNSSLEYMNYDFVTYGKLPTVEESSQQEVKNKSKTSSVETQSETAVAVSGNIETRNNRAENNSDNGLTEGESGSSIIKNSDNQNIASNKSSESNEENQEPIDVQKENSLKNNSENEKSQVKENISMESKDDEEKSKISGKVFIFLLIIIVIAAVLLSYFKIFKKKVKTNI